MQIARVNGFDCILNDHDDGMIAKIIAYYNPQDDLGLGGDLTVRYLYTDKELRTKFTTAALYDAFVKGLIIVSVDGENQGCIIPTVYLGGVVMATTGPENMDYYIAGDFDTSIL